MNKTLLHTALGACLALTVMGCTEERPYKEVFKEDKELVEKATFLKTDAEYLYVPSTVSVSRTTGATRPHWMGDAKHVKLVFSEHYLNVVEVDVTNDFSDNPTNQKPILKIPLTHIDYKCKENADGKCTQEEVVNEDISWKDKKFVEFDPGGISVQEVNFLPIQLSSLFQPSCLKAQGEGLIRSNIHANAINITIEKSFKAGLRCAGPIRELSDLGFRVQYHYSIVRLDRLADPNYKPLKYTRADETTFGFFDTKSNKLDVDNNEVAIGDNAFVNRWNPNKVITYHMNSNFLKPENRQLIQATKDAVSKINASLASVGSKMQIDLKDPDPTGSLMTGDLRVNSIVLVDDPLAMNVIGYGPSVANKRTGEILHARTVMYLGTIRKFVKRTYEEFVNKKIEELQILLKKKEAEKKGIPGDQVNDLTQLAMIADQHKEDLHAHGQHLNVTKGVQHHHDHNHRHLAGGPALGPKLPVEESLLRDKALNKRANVFSRLNEMQSEEEQIEFLMHKNCFFTSDMLAPEDGMDQEIDKLITKLELKKWTQLTQEEKQEVLDVLTPFVWIPVLVHELGHNLGLRHNFAGSEDKANFYSKEELLDMGITKPIQYSSVMDYSYSTLNELPVLGKYDLAALRFGYAEAVEMEDGSIKSLQDFRIKGGTLKAYDFCTDEHVALNPNCNRFDEGTNVLEITQHHIRAHKEGYLRNNFRNGKRDFSLFDDWTYVRRLQRSLGGMRLVFERYENIKNTFGLTDDHPAWGQFDFLKELKEATKLSAEYLTSVITTPDLMCAIATVKNPFQIVGLVPIGQISTNAVSCYDSNNLQLNPEYTVVGHTGKLFQSKKDPNNSNPYIDQIDVRGVWLDKLVALDILTGRKQNVLSFDKFRDNFLDITDVAAGVNTVLRAVTTNQVVAPVTIHTIFGQEMTVNYPVAMYDANEQQNGHRIMEPISGVGRLFGLPKGNPSFQKVVINMLKQNLISEKQVNDPDSLYNAIESFIVGIGITPPRDGFVNTTIGTRSYAAPVTSSLAAFAIASYDLTGQLKLIGVELAQKVIAEIEAGNGPGKDSSEQEKLAHMLGKDILQAYVSGVIQPQQFYAELVKDMSN